MRLGSRRILARVKNWIGLWQSINETLTCWTGRDIKNCAVVLQTTPCRSSLLTITNVLSILNYYCILPANLVRFILSFCTRKSVGREQPLESASIQAGTPSERGNSLVCSTVYTSCRHIQLRNHLRRDQGRSGMHAIRPLLFCTKPWNICACHTPGR